MKGYLVGPILAENKGDYVIYRLETLKNKMFYFFMQFCNFWSIFIDRVVE
jgi:hypothetical protein